MRLLAIGVVLFCASAQKVPTSQGGYVEHTLTMNVPGKIALVQWRIQSDHCRVQIGFPAVQDDQEQPIHAQTQVWVLKADGTAIAQTGKPNGIGWSNAGEKQDWFFYNFPPTASTEAIGVVLRVNDQLFVERLGSTTAPAKVVQAVRAFSATQETMPDLGAGPGANTGPEQKIPALTLLTHVRLSDDIDLIVMDQPEDHNPDGRLLPAVISVQVNGQSWQTLGPRGERIGLPDPGPKPLAGMALQVWILRADGTVLAQRGKPGYVGLSNLGYTTDVMTVQFDHAAPNDLAGVVVRANGKFLVGAIKP